MMSGKSASFYRGLLLTFAISGAVQSEAAVGPVCESLFVSSRARLARSLSFEHFGPEASGPMRRLFSEFGEPTQVRFSENFPKARQAELFAKIERYVNGENKRIRQEGGFYRATLDWPELAAGNSQASDQVTLLYHRQTGTVYVTSSTFTHLVGSGAVGKVAEFFPREQRIRITDIRDQNKAPVEIQIEDGAVSLGRGFVEQFAVSENGKNVVIGVNTMSAIQFNLLRVNEIGRAGRSGYETPELLYRLDKMAVGNDGTIVGLGGSRLGEIEYGLDHRQLIAFVPLNNGRKVETKQIGPKEISDADFSLRPDGELVIARVRVGQFEHQLLAYRSKTGEKTSRQLAIESGSRDAHVTSVGELHWTAGSNGRWGLEWHPVRTVRAERATERNVRLNSINSERLLSEVAKRIEYHQRPDEALFARSYHPSLRFDQKDAYVVNMSWMTDSGWTAWLMAHGSRRGPSRAGITKEAVVLYFADGRRVSPIEAYEAYAAGREASVQVLSPVYDPAY